MKKNKLYKKIIYLLILLLMVVISTKWQVAKRVIHPNLAVNIISKKTKKLSELLPKGTKINIVIDKGDYQLRVYTADTLVKVYPVVFGANPADDKLMEGDQCTPEGVFKMRSKYPHKSWSKFIWINYPTNDSWKKHNKAKLEGKIPKNAKIGGQIGIHGVPKGTDYMVKAGINWTLGCISLTNKDIDDLYPFVTKQTSITIQK